MSERNNATILIYFKKLTINTVDLTSTLLNIMGADSQKICDLIPLLHTIWIAPLQTIVATYLLYNLLGYSAFGALSAILILILLTALLMKQLKDLQTNQMTAKDFRVNLVSEAIKNLKVKFSVISNFTISHMTVSTYCNYRRLNFTPGTMFS